MWVSIKVQYSVSLFLSFVAARINACSVTSTSGISLHF